MFFFASKFLWLFAEPVNLCLMAALVGILLVRRFPVGGRRLTLAAIGVLVLFEFSPLGQLLLAPLEARFPPPPPAAPAPFGIVTLGGAIDDELTKAHGQLALEEGASRLTETALLARRYPEARIFYTGGSASAPGGVSLEAIEARDLLVGLGVAADRIGVETRSRNTDENARFSAALLKPEPGQVWLLVTSAYHMPRSMGLFRKAGFDVRAFPVDYRTFGDARDWRPNLFRVTELSLADLAIHEWTGLAAYYFAGKIDQLFPGP